MSQWAGVCECECEWVCECVCAPAALGGGAHSTWRLSLLGFSSGSHLPEVTSA